MLELLLYCHMIANIKYAGHIAAVMGFVDKAKMRCAGLFMPAVSGRGQTASVSAWWTEQELVRSLDRLDAYVSSAA